ncbi:Ig-like domain repeat protein [Edaphobacter paludis]|uniref:Ig-like domain repeat protein n=1 Tax=Edaphobacter paludis TaxID=3035702 RepID=A0AAU7DAY7_9BACT
MLTSLLGLGTVCAGAQTTGTIGTANLGANQVTLNLASSAAGEGYFTILPGSSATCGTAAQTASGEDSTSTVVLHGSLALVANTAGQYTVRNLTGSTAYTACFTPDGTVTPVSASFTTAAAQAYASPAWSTVGSADFSASTANFASLAFSPDGTPYVAYEDYGNSGKATVMRYNGTAWEAVGSAGFSAGTANFLSLAFSPDGTPYVAYMDYGNSDKATVMRYNGTAWEAVGSAGFSAGTAYYESLAFSPDGTPYVAYKDYGNSTRATVMRYNGTAWEAVGSAGFSAGTVSYMSLAFSPDGTPYVAYEDFGNSDKATVMSFNGTSWQTVGSVGFSAGTVNYTSLAFSPDGTPYVAYEDYGNSDKATVMRYNGTSWQTVGSAGFSAGIVNYTSLAFSPDGTPYVAYEDYGHSSHVTVIRYNGTSWQTVGSAGFSAGATNYESLAFSPDGTPYVAFRDNSNNSSKATVMWYGPAPTAATVAASAITSSSATLNGTVNDGGANTTVTFDYGTTTGYGTIVAATTGGTISAGSGSTAVSVDLTGLSPATIYHFRVVATAGSAVIYGSAAAFITDKATPTITAWPTASAIIYGAALSTSTLTGGTGSVAGTFAWNSPATVPVVGTASYSVTFTPTDTTNYNTVSNTVNVTVNKATPTISTLPTISAISYGAALSTSTLIGGTGSVAGTFAWNSPATVPVVGTASYSVTFTPADTANYNTVTGMVSVTVNKVTPTISMLPTASAINYGAALSTSMLTGGTSSVVGTFTWTTPATVPAAGTTSYSVTFTPTDTTNYNTVSNTVNVTVNKLTPTISMLPTASAITYGAALSTSTLTGGTGSVAGTFAWTNGATVPTAGTASYSVTFTPADTVNYAIVTGTVSVSINHVTTTTSLQSSGNQVMLQSPVTFTATVTTTSGNPSGTVTFLDGSTPLGSVTLSNGVASLAVSSLMVGAHAISAVYNGDSMYNGSSSGSLTETVIDLSITASISGGSGDGTSNATILPGDTAKVTLDLSTALNVATLPVPVTLTVGGLPTGATAAVTQSSWSQSSGTSWVLPANMTIVNPTVAITTAGLSTVARRNNPGGWTRSVPASMMLSLIFLPFFGRLRKGEKQLRGAVVILVLLMAGLAASLGLTGCGSSNGFFAQAQKSYDVTMTLTAGSMTQTTNITLTMQ